LDIVLLLQNVQDFKKFVLSLAVPHTQLVPDGGYATLHNISFNTAVSLGVE
jgi:hypothetical protein